VKKTTIAKRVGKAMRVHRLELELSQDAFADHIGMHRAYYSAIERGEKNVTLVTLHRVASGLGVTMSALLANVDG
jgi:transcriptional regulator with XRE-family HTH domain